MSKRRDHEATASAAEVPFGSWAPADGDDSNLRFSVKPGAAGGGLAVRAVDAFDGEEMVVSDVIWDGQTLRFRTVTPSTGVTMGHALEALPGGEARYSYTLEQRWLRVPDDEGPPEEAEEG